MKEMFSYLVKERKAELFLIILSSFFFLILFDYVDCHSLNAWAVSLLDVTFQGKDFWVYCEKNLRGAAHTVTPGVLYLSIPLAIWDIPAWIISRFFDFGPATTPLWLIWAKAFFMLLSVVTGYYCYKICMYFTSDKSKSSLAFIFFVGSAELLISTGYAGQDEIVYMLLAIAAFNSYLENKQKKFIILSMFAILFCPIIAILYLVFVFSNVEKLSNLILKVGIIIIPIILPSKILTLIFSNNSAYMQALAADKNSDQFGQALEWIFGRTLFPTGFGTFSVYMVIFVLILFLCIYIKDKETKEKNQYIALYLSVLMVGMCYLGWQHGYRYFIYLPFLIVYIFGSNKHFKMNILLLTILSYARTLADCANSYILTTGNLMKNNLVIAFNNLAGSMGGLNSKTIYQGLFGENNTYLMFAVSIAFAIALILLKINHPKDKLVESDFPISEKCITVVYTFCPLLFAMLFIVFSLD